MSCFLVSPKTISAVAELLKNNVYAASELPLADIRVILAEANVDSVLYRYGPQGRADYAAICPFGEDAYWEGMAGVAPIKPDEMPGLLEGQTAKEWSAQCRFGQAHEFIGEPDNWNQKKLAKALFVISNFDYQACEPSKYRESKAGMWTLLATDNLSYFLAKTVFSVDYDIDEDNTGDNLTPLVAPQTISNYAELRLAT